MKEKILAFFLGRRLEDTELSEEKFNALKELKKFNYIHIYDKASTLEDKELWENMFRKVFNSSLNAIKNNDFKHPIYKYFLNNMGKDYLDNTTNERKVIDYIAGMTDDFLIKQAKILD